MKLPQILAQTTPAVPPRSSGYADVAGAEQMAAAQGFARLGETVSSGLLRVADAAQKREDARQRAEDAIRKEEIAGETENLKATIETQVSDIESAIKTTVTEHDAVVPSWKKLAEEASRTTLSTARNPEAAAAMRRKLPGILQNSYARMLERRDKLRLDGLDATALDTADKQMSLARTDSVYDDDLFMRRVEDVFAALKPLVPMKGEAVVFKQAQEYRDQMRIEKFQRLADTDPQGAIDAADKNPLYADLPQTAKKEALTHARTLLGQRAGEMEKFYDRIEKEAEVERQDQLAGLSDLASTGGLTPAKVRQARAMGVIEGPKEFEHYMTLATAPPKETPSDPGILTSVNAGVWNADGSRFTTRQIEDLMTRHRLGGPGLNANDGKQALIEVRRQQEFKLSRADQQQRDAHAKQRESYDLAKQEGLRWLGITTTMSLLDGPSAALVAQFESDMNARVLDRSGNFVRPSREVLYELLPIYLERQSQDAKLDYQKNAGLIAATLKTQIPDPTDMGWNAWYEHAKRLVEVLKPSNPNLYEVRRTQLAELARQKLKLIETETRKGALSGGGGTGRPGQAPVRNYQPPAAVR